jgi:DnaJ-class molecular chaperone
MKDPFHDHYRQLGIEPFADIDAVKAAWRRLAKRHHPDRNPGDEGAAQRFSDAREAYRVLSDPELRRAYDESYARRTRRARDASRDPFVRRPRSEDAPSSAPEWEAPEAPPKPRPGRHRQQRVGVPLAEFEPGRRLHLRLEDQARPLDLRLPDPLWPGARLNLPGLGDPGQQGGPAGALILEFQPELPPDLQLEGSDLILEHAVNPLRLMLGGELALRHPDGRRLALRLPAGAQPGQRLRIRGQGLPAEQGRGDLVLVVAVAVPRNLSAKARALAGKLLREIGG